MDLFRQHIAQPNNLLSKEGTVKYYGAVMSLLEADDYFTRLFNRIEWKNDEVVIYGKRITTKRKIAWYGDKPFHYTYSNTTKQAHYWTPELLHLKALAEEQSGESFNSCLLNLYHDGSEGVTWHSDGEKDLKKDGAIASLSLGAERKFSFKHKATKDTVSIVLEHGSLLIMQGETQTYWQHCLPTTKKITEPRINLTFRTITAHGLT